MKLVTLNCNGIRSAARKGFYHWMADTDPDVVCLQETKAQEHQLPPEASIGAIWKSRNPAASVAVWMQRDRASHRTGARH